MAFGLTACPKPDYPQCKKDKHCNQDLGETCVDGSCQGCQTNDECADKGDGLVCHEFRCQDPDKITKRDTEGATCAQPSDCEGGLVCSVGTCQPCSDDAQCGNNSCNLNTGRCGPAGQCQVDDECPIDEICDGGMCVFPGSGQQGGTCGLDAVYFAFDSATLTPSNQSLLESAAVCIADAGEPVYLEAHADNVGTEEYNILLTERRGGQVRSFLVDNGVSPDLLQVIAKGSLEATGGDESARSKDRRVDFYKQ